MISEQDVIQPSSCVTDAGFEFFGRRIQSSLFSIPISAHSPHTEMGKGSKAKSGSVVGFAGCGGVRWNCQTGEASFPVFAGRLHPAKFRRMVTDWPSRVTREPFPRLAMRSQ